MAIVASSPRYATFAEVQERLGHVPPERIRLSGPVGSATVDDVIRINDQTGRFCELVDGILVEKPLGFAESYLAAQLAFRIMQHIDKLDLGLVLGEGGMMRLNPTLVRIPDVSFIGWDRLPNRQVPSEAVPAVVPDLAVEVLSRSNTRREMEIKRREYFEAGVRLVWEVDGRKRTIDIYRPEAADPTKLNESDTLDAVDLLPGFILPLTELFAKLEPKG